MTAAPFRELFVELPRALMETLKGVGEAACLQKLGQPPPALSRVDRAEPAAFNQMVCERYGWRSFSVAKFPWNRDREFHIVRACGHAMYGPLYEERMRAAVSIADGWLAELGRIDETRRTCTCMRP